MPEETSFFRSLGHQRRVIFALLMREALTRYGRHNIGFLWLFVEPMTFTVGVTIMWTLFRVSHGSDLPITVFALTGYSCVLLWRNMPARTIGSIQPNLALMFHRNVRIFDILLARLILEALGATMSFTILSIIFIGMEWMAPPEDMLTVVGGWLMLTWFGFGLGLFLGVMSEHTELIDKFWHPISYFLFPLSGAAFLIESLPQEMQKIVVYVPIIHCVEMVRDGYFGSHFHATYDMSYVFGVNMFLTFAALSQMRIVAKKVVPG